MSVKQTSLFEVTVTYLVCTDTQEHAQTGILRRCDAFYQAVVTREVQNPGGVDEEAVMHLHPDQDDGGEEDIPF